MAAALLEILRLGSEIDAEMKRQALEKTEALATPKQVPSWKRDKDLLAWLEAL